MGKGSSYEREISKRLSLWWTGGQRDDVFWRSSQSGGRATQRRKSGKSTYGSCGDIAALDPVGETLLKVFCIELKKGYPKASLGNTADTLNRPGRKPSEMESMISQARAAAKNAGSLSWLIVLRRTNREEMVYMTDVMYKELFRCPGLPCIEIRLTRVFHRMKKPTTVVGIDLKSFLKHIGKQRIESVWEWFGKRKRK